MPELSIAVIPGDGIGGEVIAVGKAVVEAAAARSGAFGVLWTEFGWGCDYYTRHGRMMAADGLDQLRGFDAIYFGAVGWPTVPDHVSLWGLRLAICQGLDLWANVRPVTFLPGVRGPLRNTGLAGTSWVVVRENSEGEYSGIGGRNLGARGQGGQGGEVAPTWADPARAQSSAISSSAGSGKPGSSRDFPMAAACSALRGEASSRMQAANSPG